MNLQKNAFLNILLPVFLVLIPAALYWRTHEFGFVNWDDDLYVYNNPAIRALSLQNAVKWFTKPFVALYVPVPLFSYALDYRLFGPSPGGFHITNVFFHILNTLLVFRLLRLFGASAGMSFLCALLFSVHPLQVESVAWISQRKNLLCAFFVLISLCSFIKLYSTKHKAAYAALCFLSFLLALLSKPTGILLPVLFLAYDYFYRNVRRRELAILSLFLLIPGAALALFTLSLYPGSIAALFDGGIWRSAVEWAAALLFYLKQSLLPLELDAFYAPLNLAELSLPSKIGILGGALGLVSAAVYGAWRRRPYAFWLLCFIVFLLPVISPFHVPPADRHLYLSIAALSGISAALSGKYPRAVFVVLAAAVIVFIPLSHNRLGVWRNSETLWKSVGTDHLNKQFRAKMQLAGHYEDTGRVTEAEQLYWEILGTGPRFVYPYLNLYNLYTLQGSERGKEVVLRFSEIYPGVDLAALYTELVRSKKDPEKVKEIISRTEKKAVF